MKLTESQVGRLESFLAHLRSDTYPEPPTPLHTDLTKTMLQQVLNLLKPVPGAKVLDVGCGQGVAMELFVQGGFAPIGITINPVDLQACRSKGFDVRDMDQSFLDFDDGTFDLIWCRHCLEHSIFPYFTLSELTRVLKPGGGLYVEVPAPDTSGPHQTNKNHYSVLPKSTWFDLITRSGIGALYTLDIPLKVGTGPDMYFAFFGQKSR